MYKVSWWRTEKRLNDSVPFRYRWSWVWICLKNSTADHSVNFFALWNIYSKNSLLSKAGMLHVINKLCLLASQSFDEHWPRLDWQSEWDEKANSSTTDARLHVTRLIFTPLILWNRLTCQMCVKVLFIIDCSVFTPACSRQVFVNFVHVDDTLLHFWHPDNCITHRHRHMRAHHIVNFARLINQWVLLPYSHCYVMNS
jgi:hypothetical protein